MLRFANTNEISMDVQTNTAMQPTLGYILVVTYWHSKINGAFNPYHSTHITICTQLNPMCVLNLVVSLFYKVNPSLDLHHGR